MDLQQAEDSVRIKIPKGFLTVYLANQLGVTYKTAEKNLEDNIGDLWLFLADLTVKLVNESQNEALE